jgi:hypothetical protein
MVKLELTTQQFYDIINLLATIPANHSYHTIKLLKEIGDAQAEAAIKAAKEQEKDEELSAYAPN